jgi:hypothetical protein
MFRAFLLISAMAAWGCVLDPGPERRPEILPGRYRASEGGIQLEYDFRSDGSFTFARTESGKTTVTGTGRWEYRYVGPDERYLIETAVTQRVLESDSAWHTSDKLDYKYRIPASSPEDFHLDPGSEGELPAFLMFFLFFTGSGHVVFHRL